ncbi:MAG TPA: glycosyltransferase [Sphingobacterium sp.]|nr:glycosyltransferase [Sphingobacterium sp.]
MRHGWSVIPFYTSAKEVSRKVSVLIAARDEEANIGRTLDCIIRQDFPKDLLEIIVVDDHSTDSTSDIVRSYADQGVQLIRLEKGKSLNSYKKFAITTAIAQAMGDIIVTTDADCRMGDQWLKAIVQKFEESDCYLLSSPVVYSEEKSLFERLQTLEFLYLIGLGAAGIGNGAPTTCNGANLAYRRDIFYEVDGFNGIDDLASGDDELFLHKVARRNASRITFCKAGAAVVYTDAKPDIKSFISQRKRWASKSTKYKDKRVVFLGVAIWLFNLGLTASLLIFLWFLPALYIVFLIAFGLKIAVEMFFLYPLLRFASRMDLLKYLPALSLLHSFYIVYIGILGNVGKYDWKGRKVR